MTFHLRRSLKRKAQSLVDIRAKGDTADLNVDDWSEPTLNLGSVGSVKFNSEQHILQLCEIRF